MRSDQNAFSEIHVERPRIWSKIYCRQEIQRLYSIEQQANKQLYIPPDIIAYASEYLQKSPEQVQNLLNEKKLVRELYVHWCNNMQGKRGAGNKEIRTILQEPLPTSLDRQIEKPSFSVLKPNNDLDSLIDGSGETTTEDHQESVSMEISIGTVAAKENISGDIPAHLLNSIPANLTKQERSRVVAKYKLHTKIKIGLLSGEKRSIGKENQVCVRDHVNIKMPDIADRTNVKVKCFLAPEGQVHEHVCVLGNCVRDTDPARRLAVAAIYQRNDDPHQTEYYKRGLWTQDNHIKILNSLVDTLEERTLEYTEKANRRYLRRGTKAEGHNKYIFTD